MTEMEELKDAIRQASSLEDLKRRVGPSEEERADSRAWLETADELFENYGPIEKMPTDIRVAYVQLLAKQREFDNKYL